MFPILAVSEWASVVVVAILCIFVASIIIAAVRKDGTDGGIKMWGALGTLSGVLIGAIPTYFFQQSQVEAQKQQTKTVQAALVASEKEKFAASKTIERLAENIRPVVESSGRSDTVVDLKDLKTVGKSLEDMKFSYAAGNLDPETVKKLMTSPSPSASASPPER